MSENQTLNIALRPNTFDEVLGSQTVVQAVKKQLATRVPNTFLFVGPPGSGKTTFARIIARAAQGPEFPPDSDPEYDEINAAHTNGVDDARELAATARLRPMVGKYRVIALDEAQQLTGPAQNVLLKELEREGSPTVFIFCTTDPNKIIPAIKDRAAAATYRLKGLLDVEDRKALITRALKFTGFKGDIVPLWRGLEAAGVVAPRLILGAVEKFIAGASVEEAIETAEHDPMYSEVARAVIHGNWEKTQDLLKQLKAVDVRGLRAVVAAFLKNELLESSGSRALKISEILLALGQYNTFEDGIAYAVTAAVLHVACVKLAQK